MDSASNPGGGLRSDLSDRAVADILAHFGVKGMRWGVRNQEAYSTTHTVVTNKTPKVGEAYLDKDGKEAVVLKVKPGSISNAEQVLGRPLRETDKVFDVTTQNREQYEAQQASTPKVPNPVRVAVGRTGKYTWAAARILQQSELGHTEAEHILEHIGVKGMRWGVRKSDRSSGSDGDSTIKVTTKSGKGIVKVSGGKGIDPSEDAIKVAAAKQKAKSSTTAALSNEEMKLLVGRMQLEQQYSKLMSESNQKKKSKGMEFSTWLLKSEGKALATGKPSPIIGPTSAVVKKVLASSASTGKHVKIK